MRSIFRIAGIVAIIALTFRAGMLLEKELNRTKEIGKPAYKLRSLFFSSSKSRLYLKTKTWGLTGDHSVTVLSLNSSREFFPDSTKEFILEGKDIFYRQTPDSLIIYYDFLRSKPKVFNALVKLKFIEYNNYNSLNKEALFSLHKLD